MSRDISRERPGRFRSNASNASKRISRRHFVRATLRGAAAASVLSAVIPGIAQIAGDRPARVAEGVSVQNPRTRVPVGLIIDDSTCLVNLNRFAMPQFDDAWSQGSAVYHRNWREWPAEIPDAFVRKFGEWCADRGIKGKYSIVPYPACVGRLDRGLPGWTQRELEDSLELVRTLLVPNWDIHPEMVTHTRVIDIKTGHPFPERSLKFMENWEWTTGRTPAEIADYLSYALRILKNVGLPCSGVTTPGGFGNKALPQLAQATLMAVRDVYGAEIPHYFRHLYSDGNQSVSPRVEYATGLDGPDPRCVVSIVGCAGDWTGGWDNTMPGGVDKFISEDLQSGRMVDVIQRGEPALALAHWTGMYWNGQELGLKIFQEMVRRLQARFDHMIWMKLSEIARYWAARELTHIERSGPTLKLRAPFACPDFTLRIALKSNQPPRWESGRDRTNLKEVTRPLDLNPGSWCSAGSETIVCLAMPKGESQLTLPE